MLIICDEIAHMVKRILKGLNVNGDTLALDAIKGVGFDKDLISHEHTGRLFREEFFFPQLFKQQSIYTWKKSGSKFIAEVAHECYKEIFATANPVSLPKRTDEELSGFLKKLSKREKALV